MKKTIASRGMIQAPAQLRSSIMKYAEYRLESTEEKEMEIRQYLEILPFSFLLLLIRDFLKGRDIRIRPEIDF